MNNGFLYGILDSSVLCSDDCLSNADQGKDVFNLILTSPFTWHVIKMETDKSS